MFRRLRRWLRVVIVPDAMPWILLACVFAVWAGQQLLNLWLAAFAPDLTEREMVLLNRPVHFFAIFPLAAVYGWYRATMFHPLTNRSYGTWLAQTPWRYPQTLPLGPLALVWQDLFVIALLLLPAALPPYGYRQLLHVPVILFVVAYCSVVAYANWLVRTHWACVAFALLASIGLLVFKNPIAVSTVAIAMYVVTCLGTAITLRNFPYDEQRRAELGLVAFERQPPVDVGWPISPSDENHWLFSVGLRHAATLGVLAGALFFSISYNFKDEPRFVRGLMFVHLAIALFAVAARFFIYVAGCWPPISLFGRIATRRLIIPGYDIVLLGPLAAAIVALVLPLTLILIGLPPVAAVPLATALTITLVIALPPKLETWNYTGHHRIPAARRIGRDFVQS
jgi:hypothetical protein